MAWKRIALFAFPCMILAMLWADIILLRLLAIDPGSSFLWMISDFFRGPVFSFIYAVQYFSGTGDQYIACVAVVSAVFLTLAFSRYYRAFGFLFSHLLTLGFFFACADKTALSAALYPENMKVSFEAGFFNMMHIGPSQVFLIAFGLATCLLAHVLTLAGDRPRREVRLRLMELQRF
jgi:hypothetical protein